VCLLAAAAASFLCLVAPCLKGERKKKNGLPFLQTESTLIAVQAPDN
jgi:hypothetical protein